MLKQTNQDSTNTTIKHVPTDAFVNRCKCENLLAMLFMKPVTNAFIMSYTHTSFVIMNNVFHRYDAL